LPIWPAVDLDRDAVLNAGTEYALRVELRLGPTPAKDEPTRAVAEHDYVRVRDCANQALSHLIGRHPKLGVHAGDHNIQGGKHVLALVERSILKDVHLNPSQDAKRRELSVQMTD